jgi:hypothetical protein
MAEHGEEVAAVVGDDHGRAGGARQFGDVGVVDAAPGDVFLGERLEKRRSRSRGQIVHRHATENFLLINIWASEGVSLNSGGSRVTTE